MKVIGVEQKVGTSCVMGLACATTLTATLSLSVYSQGLGGLWLSGMCNLGNDRSAHIYWNDEDVIGSGDHIFFRFKEANEATTPIRTIATDAPEYVEGQANLEELEQKLHHLPLPREKFHEKIAVELSIDGVRHSAELLDGEERIIAGVSWDTWHPNRCAVSASAFGESLPDGKRLKRKLFWQELTVGQEVELIAHSS